MTPDEKTSFRNTFVKFNVEKEKVSSISSGKTLFFIHWKIP